MNYKKLPYVEKEISPIVFGTATKTLFDGIETDRPDIEECRQKAFSLLDDVFAAGINCFDCSDHYGEEILGEWIELRGVRDKTVIFSKCAHPNKWRDRVTDFDILYDMHNALAKLRTNYVDIYMLHRDDPSVPVGIIVDTMNRLYDEGKIGAFGGSNWTHQRIEQANEYAAKHNLVPFTVSSPNFGLAEQVDNPFGGGVLDNSCEERITEQCYENHTKGNFRLYNCENIEVSDVIFTNSSTWVMSMFNCKNVHIDNVKIVGQWRYNTDGIDIVNSENVFIENSFIRSFDDTITIKAIYDYP